jgi:hypothetical protein
MKIISIFAMVMAAGSWTIPAHAAPDGADSAAPTSSGTRQTSDADDTANLLHSALGTQPALLATEEPGPTQNQVVAPDPAQVVRTTDPRTDGEPVLELPDLRDITGAPRAPAQTMPTYSVSGAKVPVFRQRDVYSTAGMEYLSFKRHPGLLVGNQFGLNADAAHEMFLEDDWRATKSDYRNMAQAMVLGGDRGEARMILKDVDAADESVRQDAELEADQPSIGQFKLNEQGSDPRLLDIQSIPFDFTVVKVKW